MGPYGAGTSRIIPGLPGRPLSPGWPLPPGCPRGPVGPGGLKMYIN